VKLFNTGPVVIVSGVMRSLVWCLCRGHKVSVVGAAVKLLT
jgi:hypothetical protein